MWEGTVPVSLRPKWSYSCPRTIAQFDEMFGGAVVEFFLAGGLPSYARTLDWCFDHLKFTLAMGLLALGLMLFIALSGIIGSEFLPHLDEGAIWVRGTLAPSTGPTSSIQMSNRVRIVLADFPEVKQVVSQVGRPDDGSDASGFYNTEFFVDLRPREEWRSQLHGKKDELVAAMDQSLQQSGARPSASTAILRKLFSDSLRNTQSLS